MGLNLIGTEDRNVLQHDGVFISADMTNYNSSGDFISHKLIDYGPYSGFVDDDVVMMYGKGMTEYANPVFNSIGIGAGYPYTGKYLTVFTFDDYRQHSWATDTLTASGNGSVFNDRLERNRVCMTVSMPINDISGYNARFGISDAHVPYPLYTAKVKSINGSTLTFDNRYWQIVDTHIGAAHVSAMTGYLQDIWYDTNVIECPANSPGGYQGYREINTQGYYRGYSGDGAVPNRAFYYNEPKYNSNELRKESMKWIINHTDNTIIICDKFNGSYRPLISGTFPDYYDMKNFRNLCIEFGQYPTNAWGGKAHFSRIVKNLKMYKLNCPVEVAIQSEPPEEEPIYKDNITQWEDFSITKETPVVAMRPGDTTLHTSNTLLDKAGMEALCPGSAFSGTGYYVYKAIWDRHTNYSGRVPKTYFCGNMASGSYDNYFSGAALPNALVDTSATGDYNVLLINFIQSGSSTTEYPMAVSGQRGYAPVDYGWYIGADDKLNYFYRESVKSENISAKYILYNVLAGNRISTRVEYCEYIPVYSSYIPICYIQSEKGYTWSIPNVIDNTNLYFSYVREPMKDSYEKGQQLWVRNSEFFHTSSYYDALNG